MTVTGRIGFPKQSTLRDSFLGLDSSVLLRGFLRERFVDNIILIDNMGLRVGSQALLVTDLVIGLACVVHLVSFI